MNNISVVIPVYNSQDCLQELIERLRAVLEQNAGHFEIILVDDCSPDQSWEEIVKLAMLDSRIKSIQLNLNFGQHNALLCGIREAQYDITVTLDDDLQHPPEEMTKLEALIKQFNKAVYRIEEVLKQRKTAFMRDAAIKRFEFTFDLACVGESPALMKCCFNARLA